jgi:hypothetical protein
VRHRSGNDCFTGPLQLPVHAAASIENYPQRNWRVLGGDVTYDLPLVPVINAKVVLFETDHQSVLSIRHGNWNQHQIHSGFDTFGLLVLSRGSARRSAVQGLRPDMNVRSIGSPETEPDSHREEEYWLAYARELGGLYDLGFPSGGE